MSYHRMKKPGLSLEQINSVNTKICIAQIVLKKSKPARAQPPPVAMTSTQDFNEDKKADAFKSWTASTLKNQAKTPVRN